MGDKCDSCAANAFLFLDQCLPCNCSGVTEECVADSQSDAVPTERCTCPPGHTGLSCENCSDGFYKVANNSCLQCNCNGRSATCDVNNGVCMVRYLYVYGIRSNCGVRSSFKEANGSSFEVEHFMINPFQLINLLNYLSSVCVLHIQYVRMYKPYIRTFSI